ncbi:uncharacterized protein [Triticum aestivum]|uniref:uncharacterized protein n=1 Tax=Triticum aestivum TaxID=4565 RepID=UPI001D012606|nr:uncharacterized protein LOC123156438 [Triticum aestivum]
MSSDSRLCKQRGSVNMRRKPKARRLKLNFDGSSKHDESRRASIGAFGGVFRDHKGKFVLGYGGRIVKATSSVAELVALRRGLELALENGRLGISIEGDFETAADAIASRACVRAKEDMKQFTAITKMLPPLGKVTVTHVGRDGNKVADCFAKLGHKAAAQRVWRDVPPDEVLVHLKQDISPRRKEKEKEIARAAAHGFYGTNGRGSRSVFQFAVRALLILL